MASISDWLEFNIKFITNPFQISRSASYLYPTLLQQLKIKNRIIMLSITIKLIFSYNQYIKCNSIRSIFN